MNRRAFLFMVLLTASSIARAKDGTVPLLIAQRLDANGKPDGLPELQQHIVAYITLKTGIEFEFRPYPWKRALKLAEEGDAAIFGLSKNAEREKIFTFSHPIYSTNIWMIVPKERQFLITSIKDLAGKRVSTFQGASFNSEFEKARDDGLFIVEEDPYSIDIRFAKLIAGRSDVMLISNRQSSIPKLTSYFMEFGFDPTRLHIIKSPLFVDQIHIGILKSKVGEFPMDLINHAIDYGRKTGEFDRM
jgi:ABC-type amino acid transport substrate-binding protein